MPGHARAVEWRCLRAEQAELLFLKMLFLLLVQAFCLGVSDTSFSDRHVRGVLLDPDEVEAFKYCSLSGAT